MSEMVNSVETREEAIARVAHDAGRIAAGETVALHLKTIEARDYQIDTWGTLDEVRAEHKDSALVHLATGLGKTTVAVIDSLKFIHEERERTGKTPRVLFACHQNEILDQAAERFADFAPALTQGKYAGGAKDIDNDLTFATLQSLYQNLGNIDPKQFDYIIYDEAHHAQAETFRQVVHHFKPGFQLALTATPDRMDEERIEELFGEPVYSKPLAEAMTEGYLADVDYHIVFDDAVKKAMDDGFKPKTLKEIRELLKNESRNEEIALQVMEEMEKIGLADAKTIVFCQNIEQADQMADLLGGKSYHSGLSSQDRHDTLDAFRANGLQVITTRDMFNEGVDIPDARLLVFLRSTSSRTIFEQQLGRGLRKNSDKDAVAVLDFVANIERLGQVKDLTDQVTDYKKRQVDQSGAVVLDGVSIVDDLSGLKIHTDHTDFDFDKISVTLLEKIGELRLADRRDWSHIKTIEEIAYVWGELYGDLKPTRRNVSIASRTGEFMSDKMLQKFGGQRALQVELGFKPQNDWTNIETIEDAVALWKDRFGDERPTTDALKSAAKDGNFMSVNNLNRVGGLSALQQALGFEVRASRKGVKRRDWSHIETIEDAAALWKENFGDTEPTQARLKDASKEGVFMSSSSVNRLGGGLALKRALGHDVGFVGIDKIEQAAEIWKDQFGDLHPTTKLIDDLSRQGRFMSNGKVQSLGGLNELRKALEIEPEPALDIQTIEDAAIAWKDQFGDLEPTEARIRAAKKEGTYVSGSKISSLGGTVALKKAIGITVFDASTVETMEDAAIVWKENFGDLKPNRQTIVEAAKQGKFIGKYVVAKLGGIAALQAAVGMETRDSSLINSIEEVAALWKEKFGDLEPTTSNIEAASKAGSFMSVSKVNTVGTIKDLRKACGIEHDAVRNAPKYTNEEIIEHAKSINRDMPFTKAAIDDLFNKGEFPVSYSTIRARFGGVGEFTKACGF